MSYKTVLFDLDGTLLDTLRDLRSSMNRALEGFSFPTHTLDTVRSYVGNGMKLFADRAVPKGTDAATTAAVLDAFRADYAEHYADETAPYDGILALLKELKARGINTAIVSNKGDFAVQLLAKRYFDDLVTLSRGEREGTPKKPAPDMVYAVMEELSADPASTLFVGDSEVDCDTAVNADLDVVLVDWGFRDRAILEARLSTLRENQRGAVVSSVDALTEVILSNE